MTQREEYINEKLILYASPRLDSMYRVNDQVLSIFNKYPEIKRITIVSIICISVILVSCGVKIDTTDWTRVFIYILIIITAYCVTSILPFMHM